MAHKIIEVVNITCGNLDSVKYRYLTDEETEIHEEVSPPRKLIWWTRIETDKNLPLNMLKKPIHIPVGRIHIPTNRWQSPFNSVEYSKWFHWLHVPALEKDS